jgi:hypothetical protein
MTANVLYTLTEVGQKAALKAGVNAAKVQSLSGEVEERDLEILDISESGAVTGDFRGLHFDAPAASIREVLDAVHARNEGKKREREEERKEQAERDRATAVTLRADLTEAIAKLERGEQASVSLAWTPQHIKYDAGIELCERYASLVKAIAEEAQAERARAHLEKQKAEEQQEREKQEYRRTWALEHLEGDELEQYNEGIFPKQELLERIANAVLDPIGPAFEWHTCQNDDHKCGTDYVSSLPPTIYPEWKRIKALLPEGSTHKFFYVKPCLLPSDGDYYEDGNDGVGAKQYGVELKVPVGPYLFDRDVEL